MDMNTYGYKRQLELSNYIDVCLNCLAYAFDQVSNSDIDVIGDTRMENLMLIAHVYEEMSQLSREPSYRSISRREILAALKGEM